jgi:hypothetical protein
LVLLLLPLLVVLHQLQVGKRTVIQELQVSPMGVIAMIYPNNSDTSARLGINIFKQVCGQAAGAVCWGQ